MEEHFSVWVFFPEGGHIPVARWVGAEEAVKIAKRETETAAARHGLVERVIITDGGDDCCFEWTFDRGVTFPRPEPN